MRVPKQAQHDHADVAHVQILLRILIGADVAGAGLALPLASLDLSGWALVNDDVRALCNGLLRQSNQLLLSELLLSGTKVTGTHAGACVCGPPGGGGRGGRLLLCSMQPCTCCCAVAPPL